MKKEDRDYNGVMITAGKTGVQIINNSFVTIIVDKDLQPGYKVAQSSHAIANFAIEHRDEFEKWQFKSNYLCCLEASKEDINKILTKLDLLKIKYSKFFEPDIGNQLTSIAVEAIPRQQHKKLFKKLKLTLS